MKNSSGRARVAKKKFGSARVAGTPQTLHMREEGHHRPGITSVQHTEGPRFDPGRKHIIPTWFNC